MRFSFLLFFLFSVSFFFNSCKSAQENFDPALTESLKNITKEYQFAGPVLFNKKLDSIRPYIQPDNPLIAEYYFQKARLYFSNLPKMQLYSDSCFSFYNSKKRISNNESGYLKALNIKASFFFLSKHYSLALSYYAEGKLIIEKGKYECESAEFGRSIGSIYYAQKRYANARLSFKNYLKQLLKCDQPPINYFYKKQAALNTIGLTYEKENKLDSALDYYQETLRFTDSMNQAISLKPAEISPTISVAYDNIGGVYLKKGDWDKAEYYLGKSLELVRPSSLDIISPILKMAELQLAKKNMADAEKYLNKSERIFVENKTENTDPYRLNWFRLKANYSLLQNKVSDAYNYLLLFNNYKDSAEYKNASLYSFNIDQEFKSLAREKELTELTQQDQIKNMSLIGGGIVLILLVVITLLMFSNLRRNKKHELNIRLQNKALQKALERLELTNKNYIRILRVMAHDFKNPLVGISGVANILIPDEADAERKELLTLIEESSTKAIGMINDLLKHGLEENDKAVEKQRLFLHELLDSSLYLLKYNAAQKDQEIVYDIPQNISIEVNQEKMWRVFNNIIVNAIKFSHRGGKIEVEAHEEKNFVIIAIKDNGIGIPTNESEEVFKMFSSAKKMGTAGEQSFGLGLSISKKIVEIHNGALWFEKNPEGGTIFFIKLPLAKTEENAPEGSLHQ